MKYNPRTEQAQSIERVAAECKAAIMKLNPPKADAIVWSELEHRWVPST